MYLNLCGGRHGPGIYLQMWDNPDSPHSQWLLEPVAQPPDGRWIILNVESSMCVQIHNGGSGSWVHTAAPDPTQQDLTSQWTFEQVADGSDEPENQESAPKYRIRSVAAGKYLALL